MKRIGEIGLQIRRAINESRGYVSAEELSAAVYQASNTVFGHKRGHSALYRVGQPVPPQGYQLTEVLDIALNPFLQVQRYVRAAPGPGELLMSADGIILFPRRLNPITGLPTDENFFQYPTSLFHPDARAWRKANDNALAQLRANSLTAPTTKQPIYSSVPGGFRIEPPPDFVDLGFLGAPPRCLFSEVPDPADPDYLVYDDATSIDIGWQDVTAINEIIAHATRLLGGQVKDQLAVGLATQTSQIGA